MIKLKKAIVFCFLMVSGCDGNTIHESEIAPHYVSNAKSIIHQYLTISKINAECKNLLVRDEWLVVCNPDNRKHHLLIYAIHKSHSDTEIYQIQAINRHAKMLSHVSNMINLHIETFLDRTDIDIHDVSRRFYQLPDEG
ncbi:TPA: hypothetical protein ACOEER_003008 [Enterobacter ludwigii]